MMQRLAELTLERDAAAAAATASARQAKLAEDDAVSLRDRICMLQAAAAAAATTMVEPLKSEVGVSEQLGGQAAQVSGAFPAVAADAVHCDWDLPMPHLCLSRNVEDGNARAAGVHPPEGSASRSSSSSSSIGHRRWQRSAHRGGSSTVGSSTVGRWARWPAPPL
jgi:hypothetical protein